MKKIFATAILILAALTIHPYTQAQKVLLDEDFNTNKNGWSAYTGTQVNYLIYNGKYVVAVNDSLTYNIGMPTTLDDGNNFSITVTTTHTDGTSTYGYGIYFGSSDLSNYYSFQIASGGYYRISKYTSAGFTDITKWTTSALVKTGNYVDNILQLSRQGSNWIFGVNGQTLATVQAMPFMGNKIGFTQSVMQRVEYDDVKVVVN